MMSLNVNFKKALLIFIALMAIGLIYLLAKALYYTRAELYELRGVSKAYVCELDDCNEVEKYKEHGWRITRDDSFEHGLNFSRYLPSGEVMLFVFLDDSEKNILTVYPTAETMEKVFGFTRKDPEYQEHIWSPSKKWENAVEGTVLNDGYTRGDPFKFISTYTVSAGCEQSYYVHFTLAGEILRSGISEPYCPGPY